MPPSAPMRLDDLAWLEGGGEMAERIAAFNWAATPLGPISAWSASLRTAVALVVRARLAMTLLWGPHGIMIYNDAYAVIAGARHPASLGSDPRETWPEIRAFNDEVLRRVLAGEALTFADQKMTLLRNGEPEEVRLTLDYSPVIDETHRPAGVLAVVADTTEKARAEQWLRDERERLRQMFDQAPGFMALLRGPDQVFDLVNEAYLQLVGHRDLLGRTVRQAFPDIEGQGFHELLDGVYRSGTAYRGYAMPLVLQRTRGAAGEQAFIDFIYQAVRDPAGEVIGIFVEGADVTDRVRAEAAVIESEARNRQILDSAVDYAIIAFNMEGRVTLWNEGARRVLGWTEAEMLGQDADRIFTPEDRASGRMVEEMLRAMDRGVDERWHIRKSGERFWASGEMTPIRNAEGVAVGMVKVLRDRTEQHRAAEALRQSEARLRRAQEAGGVGLFDLDLTNNIVHGTPEFFRLYGWEPSEAVSAEMISALVAPEDWHAIWVARSTDPENAPRNVEYRIRRADDGAQRWIARQAEYDRDAEGRPTRLVGVVQDVTERKIAERAVAESAAQFRTFAQTLPNHVWTAPADGRVDWCNDRVYEYTGVKPGELDEEAWTRLMHPEDRTEADARWRAVLSSGETFEAEFRLRRADGAYRWHLARAVPIVDGDGAISRWVGTSTDIQARKEVEVESARDRDRIWNSTNDLMALAGLDGELKSVNPAWSRLLGYDEAELVGRPFVAFVAPEDHPRLVSALDRLAAGEAVDDLEHRLVHKDGRRSLIAWSAEPLGEVFYAVGRNVTEQRAAEAALRQAQKMEAVGQLTGGIAHDFNNLLQGITGSLELMRKRIAQDRMGELDRLIAAATSSAHRAAALTHRLLAFSRRQPLDPRPVQANPLIAGMGDLLRRTLGERILLDLVLDAGLWTTQCDPNQLENAILNLVINARDAMPDGGRVTIETSNVVLDAAYAARDLEVLPGGYVCIAVSDTGVGMSADTIAKAFEPFFTTKPIGQGTGLGLSMIYGFARQSEGQARIYSEVGVGTTFKLYLPRYVGDTPEDEAPADALAAPTAGANEVVLVVEDEVVVRGLIVDVLRDLGYRALEAADGPTGLAILQSPRRIDLLVTDIGLPGLNGRQIAEAARETRPELKVLFMTGYAENAAIPSGFLEPGMSMITKPFAIEALATRLREILEPDV